MACLTRRGFLNNVAASGVLLAAEPCLKRIDSLHKMITTDILIKSKNTPFNNNVLSTATDYDDRQLYTPDEFILNNRIYSQVLNALEGGLLNGDCSHHDFVSQFAKPYAHFFGRSRLFNYLGKTGCSCDDVAISHAQSEIEYDFDELASSASSYSDEDNYYSSWHDNCEKIPCSQHVSSFCDDFDEPCDRRCLLCEQIIDHLCRDRIIELFVKKVVEVKGEGIADYAVDFFWAKPKRFSISIYSFNMLIEPWNLRTLPDWVLGHPITTLGELDHYRRKITRDSLRHPYAKEIKRAANEHHFGIIRGLSRVFLDQISKDDKVSLLAFKIADTIGELDRLPLNGPIPKNLARDIFKRALTHHPDAYEDAAIALSILKDRSSVKRLLELAEEDKDIELSIFKAVTDIDFRTGMPLLRQYHDRPREPWCPPGVEDCMPRCKLLREFPYQFSFTSIPRQMSKLSDSTLDRLIVEQIPIKGCLSEVIIERMKRNRIKNNWVALNLIKKHGSNIDIIRILKTLLIKDPKRSYHFALSTIQHSHWEVRLMSAISIMSYAYYRGKPKNIYSDLDLE